MSFELFNVLMALFTMGVLSVVTCIVIVIERKKRRRK